MLVKMTLNKILSIVNTLVSLDMHDNFFKKSALGVVWKKSPPSIWKKILDFLHKAALKCPCFTESKIFFSFISYRNVSDRAKCVILKSWEIYNESDIIYKCFETRNCTSLKNDSTIICIGNNC